MRRSALAVVCAVVLGAASSAAHAQFEPITDREYGIDLYSGAVLGSARVVGMGGATVAVEEGSAGQVANPAAVATRPATSNDTWAWDWHVDWLNPAYGSDFDNNGIETEEGFEALLLTGGILGQYKSWGLGFTATLSQRPVDHPDGSGAKLIPSFTILRFGLARALHDDEWTVGLGVRIGSFEMDRRLGRTQTLFKLTGSALETGVTWRPPQRDFRAAVVTSFPVVGRELDVANCDPFDCAGYILPEQVSVPWRVSIGGGYRFGATRWNRKVAADWRDERALLIASDIVVTGPATDGYGIEAFVNGQLQPSGRNAVVSIRGGAEYEWIPGRLRVRLGSYWEPGRFEGVGGRIHGTFGVEGSVYEFGLWGDRYRVRLSLTADAASKYGNTAVSVGFWH